MGYDLQDKSEIHIRFLRESDIEVAATIVSKNYSLEYGACAGRELADMFGSASIRPIYFVAELRGNVVGFAGFIQAWMDYNIYELFWVNVDPAVQGRGIGGLLIGTIIREVKTYENARMILLTARGDSHLPEYYQRFGFITLCEFGSDYSLMCLSI